MGHGYEPRLHTGNGARSVRSAVWKGKSRTVGNENPARTLLRRLEIPMERQAWRAGARKTSLTYRAARVIRWRRAWEEGRVCRLHSELCSSSEWTGLEVRRAMGFSG